MHTPPAMDRTQELSRRRAGWAALAVLLAVAGVLLLAHRGQEPPRSRAGVTPPRLHDDERRPSE